MRSAASSVPVATLGLLLGLVDVGLALVREQVQVSHLRFLLIPVVTVAVFFCLTFALVLALSRALQRLRNRELRPLFVTTGATLAAIFAGGLAAEPVELRMTDGLASSLRAAAPLSYQLLGFFAVAIIALSWGAFRGSSRRPGSEPASSAVASNSSLSRIETASRGLVALLLALLLVLVVPPSFSVQLRALAGGEQGDSELVLLISVDSLRADRLRVYNDGRGSGDRASRVMPNVDRLVEQGFWFERAWSTAPWTLPSLVSMMTGTEARDHQITDLRQNLPDGVETLAESLATRGYETSFVGSSVHLTRGVLAQGFERFDAYPKRHLATSLGTRLVRPQSLPGTSAPERLGLSRESGWFHRLQSRLGLAASAHLSSLETVRRGLEEIERIGSDRLFLWLHFLDPHIPYRPARDRLQTLDTWRVGRVAPGFGDVAAARRGDFRPSLDERQHLERLYDLEVAQLDDALGVLFDQLRQRGWWERTTIVLVSDHGEEFYDHGDWEHGHTLYEELIHVPFVVKPRGELGTRRFGPQAAPISLTQLPAVVTALVDGDDPSSADGGSESLPLASAVFYGPAQTAVGSADLKLIVDEGLSRIRVFDRLADPGERFILGVERPGVAELLARAAAGAQDEAGQTVPPTSELSERELEQLEALGYLENEDDD